MLLLCLPALAQKPEEGIGSGIIYGTNHAYALSAPKGWVMDNQSGVSQGVFGVFYPSGSSWGKGSVVMFTNVIQKRDEKQALAEVTTAELADSQQHLPGLKIADAPALPTRIRGNNPPALPIQSSFPVVNSPFSILNCFALAFAELVRSYFFISDNVVIEK